VDGSFQVGRWRVEPGLNTVARNGTTLRLEPKVMDVLVCLAEHAGEAVSKETLLQAVWPGIFVSDDVVSRSISELRRIFEDDAREPTMIQTIPKRGYRLVAPVEWVNGATKSASPPSSETDGTQVVNGNKLRMAALAVVTGALIFGFLGSNIGGLRARLAGKTDPPQIHSLAVLPLQNLSADPAQEYFSDGMTDALITSLAQIGSLKVISRTSSMQYKQTKKSLSEIARELNVDGIVEGTVQRSGDRVRITAQLIYGPSDKHLWANGYERDVRDVFALERDVTSEIARQVQARVITPKRGPPAEPKPVAPKVLEAYLQGNYHLSRNGQGVGQDELEKAAKYFQQAIDDDPNFAPAYNGLASTYMSRQRGSSENAALERKAAEKAAELDPNYSDGQDTLGFIKWQPGLDWGGAEENLRTAIALNANNADARSSFGLLLMAMGRVDEGLRECNVAQQLDPNQDNSSMCLYFAHDYDGSIAILRVMLQKNPNDGFSHCYISQDYSKIGLLKEAIQELTQCYSLFGFTKAAANIRRAFAASGYRGAILQWTKEIEHLQLTNQAFLPGNLAAAYTILGDNDRAFYWLEEAYKHREMVSIDGGIFFLGSEPMYDPLRSDPRFKDLLRRVGLPQ
jgi:TolB-like protein/DNA-binding winged helix-turn-helix (wHTH) protein/Tfp pilus assembly protein PilF